MVILLLVVSVMTMPRNGVVVSSAGREFHLPAGALMMRLSADIGKGRLKRGRMMNTGRYDAPDTPADLLKAFAANLPTTIRDLILARCCIGFGRLEGRPNQDLLAAFDEIMDEVKGHELAYRCAMMAGAMELALQNEGPDPESFNREMYEQLGNPMFKAKELQAPLDKRHWAQAVEEYDVLRSAGLHPYALRLWQLDYLAANPPRMPW
jgi:hypothetical protein